MTEDKAKLTLAQRLHEIMKEVEYIRKRPKAGLPYPYVAHDDVSEALRGAFLKWGVLCLPSVVTERQEGNRCVLKATITLLKMLMVPTGERDIEQDQVEQTFLDTDLVQQVAQAITDGDGAKIKSLMHNRPDEVQIAVWRHLNTAAKKTAKQLLAELPA